MANSVNRRIYKTVRDATKAVLMGKYKKTNSQAEELLKHHNYGGYKSDGVKLFNKRIDWASRRAGATFHIKKKPTKHLEPKMWGPSSKPVDMSHPDFTKMSEVKSLLQEAVKRLNEKKQKIRNEYWQTNYRRTRLTETIMSEAAEDYILGQGNH